MSFRGQGGLSSPRIVIPIVMENLFIFQAIRSWTLKLLKWISAQRVLLPWKRSKVQHRFITVCLHSHALHKYHVFAFNIGSRTPKTDPLARGCLLGLSLLHTRGHIWRALMVHIFVDVRMRKNDTYRC